MGTDHAEARALLSGIASLPDEQIDLAEAALALASLDHPHVDLGRYRDHLAELTGEVGKLVATGRDPAGAARHVLHDTLQYRGDTLTYDDIQNANLVRVIDRRMGLPISLGILYLHAIRANGGQGEGLGFPGHFLVRSTVAGERVILDPFHGGVQRTASELRDLLKAVAGLDAELQAGHFSVVSNRDILVRLQNNISVRHRQAGRLQDLLVVLERVMLFAPDRPEVLWDLGRVHASLGNLKSAATAFEALLALPVDTSVHREAAEALATLRRRLN